VDAITTHPRFAVVGHPNKGKSSIVASLAQDDTVQISDTPGTTVRTRAFPLRIDGRVLYELYDTPGFQRARRVLAWLEAEPVRADERPERVRAFVRAHRDDPMFADEVELLRPIMEGAGILYVVDGAKPYGPEYEAEMEILRWTGQPSMALINTIGSGDHTQEWERALHQYFRLVRRYDPMRGDVQEQIALLEAIAQLDAGWVAPIREAIDALRYHREDRLTQTARIIAELLRGAITHVESVRCEGDGEDAAGQARLRARYQEALRRKESDAQSRIEKVWHHTRLEKDTADLPLEGTDLFSRESASIFGLSRQEMVIAGATGGAAAGAGIDLLLAGHTLLLGGLIGGVVGGVGAWWGFDELSEVRILGARLGQCRLEMGPMANRNFPWILLGRALYHLHTVASRSHAVRTAAGDGRGVPAAVDGR